MVGLLDRTPVPPSAVAALLDAVPSSAVLMDLEGRITAWNHAAEELTGWCRAEALGRSFADLLALSAEQRRCLQRLARSPRGTTPARFSVEVEVRRRDGGARTVALRLGALELDGTRCIAAFETEPPHWEELRGSLLRTQKLEATARLAAAIAHDFNNLLIVVLGGGEALVQKLPEGDARRELAQEVLAAGRRGAALARQLLAFSRPASEQLEALDVNGVLLNLEPLLRRLAGPSVRVLTVLSASEVRVRAARGPLEQLVVNLVINARDAMPSGGALCIETRLLEVGPLTDLGPVSLAPGAYVALSFSDDGEGIDEPTQARIFEPYFTTKASQGGTGLGLWTCRRIAQELEGEITVASEPGKGSRFVVYFPARAGSDASQRPRPGR